MFTSLRKISKFQRIQFKQFASLTNKPNYFNGHKMNDKPPNTQNFKIYTNIARKQLTKHIFKLDIEDFLKNITEKDCIQLDDWYEPDVAIEAFLMERRKLMATMQHYEKIIDV